MHEAPACVTVKVWPPAVMVPVLVAPPVFCATEYPTLPLPVPLLPDVIVIHESVVTAVQEQPVMEVSAMVPVPPVEVNELLVGAME